MVNVEGSCIDGDRWSVIGDGQDKVYGIFPPFRATFLPATFPLGILPRGVQ